MSLTLSAPPYEEMVPAATPTHDERPMLQQVNLEFEVEQ
jgi:hypothetical protein